MSAKRQLLNIAFNNSVTIGAFYIQPEATFIKSGLVISKECRDAYCPGLRSASAMGGPLSTSHRGRFVSA